MKHKIFSLFILAFLLFPTIVFADKLEITGSAVNVRSLPSTKGTLLRQTNHGDTFDLLSSEKVLDQGGCKAGWYKIKVDGATAYVCSTYGRVITETVVVDPSAVSECEKKLASKGFPKEYWSGLCSLQVKHPNWQFVPINTGLDFKVAVEKESACGVNSLSTSNPEYIDTSCNKKLDSGYKAVSQKAVAHYLNPLNFFDEKNIFMFESNGVNSGINDDAYTKTTTSILDAKMLNFLPMLAGSINSASRTNGINQVMVSSRIRQELGSGIASSDIYKGQLLSCISGEYTKRWNIFYEIKENDVLKERINLDYYYNFFNVGVTDGSNGDAAYRAVVAAYKRGWGGSGNREQDVLKAINGGILFLKNNYVLAGQDSIYFHKFNVHPVNSSSLYTHQYMSNLAAPSSEATIAYNAYKNNNMLNSPFIFNIPIYNNLDATIDNTPNGPSDEDDEPPKSEALPVETIVVSSGFKLSGNKISGLTVGMTLNDIENKIRAIGGSLVGADLKKKVATGLKIKISNGKNTSEYILIVKGDTSGDGEINALDLLQVQKNILGTYKINDDIKAAGDTSGDGEINALDLLQVQKNILGTYKIAQ